jgi:hypothetical protein
MGSILLWALAGFAIMALFAFHSLRSASVLGVQTIQIGDRLKLDWQDVIALLVVGVAIYGIATRQISVQTLLGLLLGALAGKAITGVADS